MSTIKRVFLRHLLYCFNSCSVEHKGQISLSGDWVVKLGSLNIGASEKWQNKKLKGEMVFIAGHAVGCKYWKAKHFRSRFEQLCFVQFNQEA